MFTIISVILLKPSNISINKKLACYFIAETWDRPFTLRPYRDLKCPIKGVLGNGDPDIQKFKYQLENLEILKDLNNFLIESELLDVLCIGHDHRPKIETKGKTLVINPGSLVGYMYEEGNMPVTVALYDTKKREAKIIDLGI